MAEQRVQRRLAAILAADVVGYSRLMREDETSTLAQLKTLNLGDTQITDDGCAHLASRLRSGALSALEELYLFGTRVSGAARAAVYEARPGLDGREY